MPVVWVAPVSPAETAPAAAIAAEVTVDALGGAAASLALAGAGDEAFLSGGLKYTGKGFPPMGLPFSSMLSYGIQQTQGLSIRMLSKDVVQDKSAILQVVQAEALTTYCNGLAVITLKIPRSCLS